MARRTTGSCEVKPTLVDHRSPAAGVAIDDEPTVRSVETGIATRPAGADGEMPSGRSAGVNAERCTVSE